MGNLDKKNKERKALRISGCPQELSPPPKKLKTSNGHGVDVLNESNRNSIKDGVDMSVLDSQENVSACKTIDPNSVDHRNACRTSEDDELTPIDAESLKDYALLTEEEKGEIKAILEEEHQKKMIKIKKKIKKQAAFIPRDSGIDPNIKYVLEWKNNRQNWKFSKKREIWLIKNWLDLYTISNAYWPCVLEYFCSIKGFRLSNLYNSSKLACINWDSIHPDKKKLPPDSDEILFYERANSLRKALKSIVKKQVNDENTTESKQE